MSQRTTEKGLNIFIETENKIIISDLKLEKKKDIQRLRRIFFFRYDSVCRYLYEKCLQCEETKQVVRIYVLNSLYNTPSSPSLKNHCLSLNLQQYFLDELKFKSYLRLI